MHEMLALMEVVTKLICFRWRPPFGIVTPVMRVSAFGSLTFAIWCIVPTNVEAFEYTVKGQVSYTVYNSYPLHGNSITNAFQIDVRDCQWFITTSNIGYPSAVLYYEMGCDGTNHYSVQILTPESISKFRTAALQENAERKRTNAVLDFTALVSIGPGVVPPSDISLAAPVWLAYASSCYFQGVTNGLLKPVWDFAPREMLYLVPSLPANWRLADQEPRLPLEVTYFSDGKIYSWQPNSTTLIFTNSDVPPFGNGGYTNGAYTVIGMTNITPSLAVPSEFLLRRFCPRYHSATSSDDIVPFVDYKGLALSVEAHCSRDSFKPLIPTPASVDVYTMTQRHPPVSSIHYMATNEDDWRGLSDKYLRFEYKYQARMNAYLSNRPHRSVRDIFFALFCIGSSLAAILIFFVSRRSRAGT